MLAKEKTARNILCVFLPNNIFSLTIIIILAIISYQEARFHFLHACKQAMKKGFPNILPFHLSYCFLFSSCCVSYNNIKGHDIGVL